MRATCDGECKTYRKILKVIRYDNSPTVKYVCGPCDEAYRNLKAKQRTFRPQQRRAA